MCVHMLYLMAEELYRDFPWCQRSMKSLRSEAKKKHVQLICREYDIAGATDVSIKRLLKDWKKEEEK